MLSGFLLLFWMLSSGRSSFEEENKLLIPVDVTGLLDILLFVPRIIRDSPHPPEFGRRANPLVQKRARLRPFYTRIICLKLYLKWLSISTGCQLGWNMICWVVSYDLSFTVFLTGFRYARVHIPLSTWWFKSGSSVCQSVRWSSLNIPGGEMI